MALAYYAVIYFVAGILSFVFIKDSEESIASAKATKEDYIELFKSPGLWMVALLVLGTYSIFALQSYTTPYGSVLKLENLSKLKCTDGSTLDKFSSSIDCLVNRVM